MIFWMFDSDRDGVLELEVSMLLPMILLIFYD